MWAQPTTLQQARNEPAPKRHGRAYTRSTEELEVGPRRLEAEEGNRQGVEEEEEEEEEEEGQMEEGE